MAKWESEMIFDYANFYDAVIDDCPRGSRVVEVGTYIGESLSHLAVGAYPKKLQVIGVDWGVTIEKVDAATARATVKPYVNTLVDNILKTHIPGGIPIILWDSAYAARLISNRSCRFVYIDADHNYHAVYRDLLAWMPKIQRGGILAGHDYDWPTVKAAVDEVFGPCQSSINPRVWSVRRTFFGWKPCLL